MPKTWSAKMAAWLSILLSARLHPWLAFRRPQTTCPNFPKWGLLFTVLDNYCIHFQLELGKSTIFISSRKISSSDGTDCSALSDCEFRQFERKNSTLSRKSDFREPTSEGNASKSKNQPNHQMTSKIQTKLIQLKSGWKLAVAEKEQ